MRIGSALGVALVAYGGYAGAFDLVPHPSAVEWTATQDSATQRIEVENPSDTPVQIHAQASDVSRAGETGPSSWRVTVDLADFALGAGSKRSIHLSFAGGEHSLAGDYQAEITLQARTTGWKDVSVPVRIHVPPEMGIAVDGSPVTEIHGRSVTMREGFYVDATVQRIQFSVSASALQPESFASGREVAPLSLDLTQGAQITAENAISTGGAAARTAFQSGAMQGGDATVWNTDSVLFWTRDGTPFAQRVFVTVHWTIKDQLQPAGSYAGSVRLAGLVMPE